MPLLSIIIPTYNRENCISACIGSILSQKFENYEIVIQDALSTDRTLELIRKAQIEHPSISFIIKSEKDKGIYDAINKGIETARGEWLYFLGSDDRLYDDNVLLHIFSRPEVKQYDVLYGNVNSVRFKGVYDGEFTQEKLLERNICHQAIFFKRSVFKKVGLYSLKYKAHADWDHNIRWYFSDKLSNRYIDVIVAEYADGGFSSTNYDTEFLKIKNLNYLVYGRNVLKVKTKIKLLTRELDTALRSSDIRWIWKIVVKAPSILL